MKKRKGDERVAVFGLPKSASRSLQIAVRQQQDTFIDHRAYRKGTRQVYDQHSHMHRRVFMRNPIERVYSAWRYLRSGGRNEDDKQDALMYVRLSETFEQFVHRVFDDTVPVITEQLHFRPANLWLYESGIMDDTWDLVRLDAVANYYPVGRYNRSEYQEPLKISMDACEVLRRVYEEEWAMYGRCKPQ